jgi:hypothetical protein
VQQVALMTGNQFTGFDQASLTVEKIQSYPYFTTEYCVSIYHRQGSPARK